VRGSELATPGITVVDARVARRPPLTSGPAGQRALAAVCLVLGLCSVAPLLAWVYGLGAFAVWFWALAMPGLAVIAGVCLWLRRARTYPDLQVAIVAGTLGGIAGTIGYDLVRVPFLAFGLRLFAPIDSYGLLILNVSHSSPLTAFAGWSYNVSNGIGFGIGYAMLGVGRRWWWAIPWALWLETMTIVTPYAQSYGIAGHADLIAIAYGAHVAYAAPLGVLALQAARWRRLDESPLPVSWALAGVLAVLLVWHRPWAAPSGLHAAESLEPQPASLVEAGAFVPEWVRIPAGGCLTLVNHDATSYTLGSVPGAHTLAAHAEGRFCFGDTGVKRVQLNGVPYSGGFVIVDAALHR
jgi:hypothetical protein